MDKLLTITTLWFSIIAFAGILAHVLKKSSKDEVHISIHDWFITNYESTVGMFCAVYGALFTGIGVGQLNNVNDFNQISLVFLLGYAGNSAINKQ